MAAAEEVVGGLLVELAFVEDIDEGDVLTGAVEAAAVDEPR